MRKRNRTSKTGGAEKCENEMAEGSSLRPFPGRERTGRLRPGLGLGWRPARFTENAFRRYNHAEILKRASFALQAKDFFHKGDRQGSN
jgi:hypothetical protein